MKRAALEERRACVQIRPGPLLALISSETHTLLSEAQFHTQETERGAVCRVSSRVLTPYNFNCRKIIPAAKLHYRDAESAVRPQERSSLGGRGGHIARRKPAEDGGPLGRHVISPIRNMASFRPPLAHGPSSRSHLVVCLCSLRASSLSLRRLFRIQCQVVPGSPFL